MGQKAVFTSITKESGLKDLGNSTPMPGLMHLKGKYDLDDKTQSGKKLWTIADSIPDTAPTVWLYYE